VELEELHVLEREALAPDDADAVAGEGVRVRGGLEDLAAPPVARSTDLARKTWVAVAGSWRPAAPEALLDLAGPPEDQVST
jgi:hypothetical protein